MVKSFDPNGDDGQVDAGESGAPDAYRRGELLNALAAAAYTGRIDRRAFLGALLKAGVASAVAVAWADRAAQAAENQTQRRANLRAGYDYVIAGAGTAGCVLANRLSADPSASVLVLEAGPGELDQPRITDPFVWFTNIGSELDWARPTVPQDQLDNRTLLLPAGRVVGGSSSINVAMWLRGDERDYETWAEVGGPSWGFGPARRAFKRIEDYRGEGGPARGRDGPIPVGVPVAKHPLSPLLLQAAKEIGVRRIQMNERPQIDGADFVDENVDATGRRIGAAQGYLLPVLDRPNLTLLTRTEVTGLLFAGNRCRGVSAVHEGQQREFAAARDVVLCAGAFGTPKLLLLSGIGPADELREVGVLPRRDLPAVGRNLQDHVLLPGFYFEASRKLPPPVTNGVSTVTYLRTNPTTEGPNVQLVSLHFALLSNTFAPQEAYIVWPVLMRPTSRGQVRLASAGPNASLLIDPNYLETVTDWTALRQGLVWALELGNARTLSRWRRGTLSLRDFAPEGADAFIRQNAGTDFHPLGTCAFGLDPGRSVVDARSLRVWDVDGLRVVDASVIPEIPSVNTHVPVLIVAELAAEMIAGARQPAAIAG